MGTGIRDMIRRYKKAGLQEPEIGIDGGFRVLTIRRKNFKGKVPEQVEAHDEVHELGSRYGFSRKVERKGMNLQQKQKPEPEIPPYR